VNSGITSGRVYEALKGRLLGAEFRPGERLEPALLSETVASSVTPVREALNILLGEGLVEARTGSGFHVRSIDEPGLADLYAWNSEVLAAALRGWPATATRLHPDTAADAVTARRCFERLAGGSTNAEHLVAVRRLSDRLGAARHVEGRIIGDGQTECAAILAAAGAGDRRTAARLIAAYHRRRIHHAAAIVRQLYRSR
jgi:hypothetical protein